LLKKKHNNKVSDESHRFTILTILFWTAENIIINFKTKIQKFTDSMKKRLNKNALNFSKDKAWMNNTIILSKHTLVWLSQLSKKYNKK